VLADQVHSPGRMRSYQRRPAVEVLESHGDRDYRTTIMRS
jgi:hypothetical protein